MSAVIADIEQMRTAFSDYLADFFRQVFQSGHLRRRAPRN